ncbi:MAG: RluA family pseudouridine synthase [Planctomycetota bacterium]|jgi:RluA family pseudouridine synthase|nr:RluA family pseudouridine synthase [Planctomycetota bacterium]
MPTFTAGRSGKLLDILKDALPDWKTPTLKQRLKNRLVLVNAAVVASGAARVEAGDAVEILAVPPTPASRLPLGLGPPPLDILYADDWLLAVDKPSGLLSVASERERNLTAVRLMRDWLQGLDREPCRDLHAAHRLDREASGVLLFARSLEGKRQLARSWHTFEKAYLAVVDGVPQQPEGVIDAPLWEDKSLFVRVATRGDGEAALTRYRLVRKTGNRSLLEVHLGTGRKHQIRVHLAHIGCPIVGDPRYGVSKAPRLALHARTLRFRHPHDGRPIEVTAPEPPEFKRFLKKSAQESSGRERIVR